jgi:hypothetical protein
MSEHETTLSWFIIRTKPMAHRQHLDDKPDRMDVWLKRLNDLGWDTYYPLISELRRVPRRKLSLAQRNSRTPLVRPWTVPFLPSYVFVRGREISEVKDIPCVTGYVTTSGRAPAQISHELVARLRGREVCGAIPGMTPAKCVFGDQAMNANQAENRSKVELTDFDLATRLKMILDTFGRATRPDLPLASTLLSYEPDCYLDPDSEIVGSAIKIIQPSLDEEAVCRMMVVYVMNLCRVQEKEISPAFLAAREELNSIIERIEGAEKALAGLRRLYKRLAFPDRDDFDSIGTEEAERLTELRKHLQALADRYVSPPRSRPPNAAKLAAASYAYCVLVAYSDRPPTLATDGTYFRLASVIYEGATGKEANLEHHCRLNFHERGGGVPASARTQYHADLRRSLREGQKGWLIKLLN